MCGRTLKSAHKLWVRLCLERERCAFFLPKESEWMQMERRQGIIRVPGCVLTTLYVTRHIASLKLTLTIRYRKKSQETFICSSSSQPLQWRQGVQTLKSISSYPSISLEPSSCKEGGGARSWLCDYGHFLPDFRSLEHLWKSKHAGFTCILPLSCSSAIHAGHLGFLLHHRSNSTGRHIRFTSDSPGFLHYICLGFILVTLRRLNFPSGLDIYILYIRS